MIIEPISRGLGSHKEIWKVMINYAEIMLNSNYQSLNFKKPMYINDTVEAIVTVADVDLEKRRVKFKTVCKVDNKTVTDGGFN